MFQYPETIGRGVDMLDAGPVAEVAQAAEAAGFAGFAFTEHPAPAAKWLDLGGHQTLDPFVSLGFVAAATDRIKLLTYLAVVPYRNPLMLAKAAATVDILSGGRLILGLGTGYLKGEFHAVGADFDEQNTAVDEALDVMPMHWSGEPFDYKGSHFEARGAIGLPAPRQRAIPIWIGGNSALTRRRVAERAQGWMPLTGPPEVFAATRTVALDDQTELTPAITALRTAAGDRGPTLEVLVAYPDRTIAEPGCDLAPHRAAFDAYEAAGVTAVMVAVETGTRADTLRFIERFGASFIAA